MSISMVSVGRKDHDIAGPEKIFSPLRIDFGLALGDPGDLLVGMVMQRHGRALLRSPFHQSRMRAGEILPLQQLRDLLHWLGVELIEQRDRRSVLADIRDDASPRRLGDMGFGVQRRCDCRRGVGGNFRLAHFWPLMLA